MRNSFRCHWLRFIFCALSLGLASCSRPSDPPKIENWSENNPAVIYGEDNRIEYYQILEAQKRALADSTVALFRETDLRSQDDRVGLPTDTLMSGVGVCEQEPFARQPIGAFCSGTLIGKDLVLTAGHCIRTASACATTQFVFTYRMESSTHSLSTVAASEVYRCAELIYREENSAGADFAIVKLDRPVMNHTSVPLKTTGDVAVNENILVIGYPVGLPLKLADGAKVRSNQNSGYFVANLDTYGGNSGSGVFDSAHQLVGVLVRGEQDFMMQGRCALSNRCANGSCRGEDVTKVSAILPHLPSGPVDPPPPPLENSVFVQDTELLIPDLSIGGVSSDLIATSAVSGRRVLLEIQIEHTFIGDLVIQLVSPSGKIKVLQSRKGGSRDNLSGTYGLDLVPQSSLVDLANEDEGVWKLVIADLARRDEGRLISWKLIFH